MRISPLASLLLAALTISAAHADTIKFASTPGVTTYTFAAGFGSMSGSGGTAVAYSDSAYATPIVGSKWVSSDSRGGNGTVGVTNYTNSFTLLAGQSYAGSFSFMADDYAGVLVNGVEVYAFSSMTGYVNPTTISLLPSYFKSGVNTITVEDFSNNGPAAADFAGTLTGTAITSEPSSLFLLGTGLLGAIGAARRRFRSV